MNEPEYEIGRIVKQLESRKKEEREWAERRLREFGPSAIQELLNTLVHEKQKRKSQKSLYIGMIVGYFVLMIAIAIITHSPGMLGFIGSIGGFTAMLFAVSQTQKSITLILAQLADVRAVGALAEALEYTDQEIVKAAEMALIRLLPLLKASDEALLNAQQRTCLNHALNRKNSELAIAIIKAWEQVGDSHALPVVQKLADGEGRAAKDSKLRRAAQECLPALTLRAEEERSRQTLLRAAGATNDFATPADLLLRPASGGAATDTRELLRTASEQSEVAIGDVITPLLRGPQITLGASGGSNTIPLPLTSGGTDTIHLASPASGGELSLDPPPAGGRGVSSYAQQPEEATVVTVGHQGQVV